MRGWVDTPIHGFGYGDKGKHTPTPKRNMANENKNVVASQGESSTQTQIVVSSPAYPMLSKLDLMRNRGVSLKASQINLLGSKVLGTYTVDIEPKVSKDASYMVYRISPDFVMIRGVENPLIVGQPYDIHLTILESDVETNELNLVSKLWASQI